ncbi:MAG: radical SAM protein [Candidatus Omnitrophota bacterium]
MNKKRVFIITNGCDRRSLDSTRLDNFFKLNNCVIVKTEKTADYIIFVTCCFKKTKEEECLREINKFLKCKGELIIIGCLPDISPNRLKEVFKGRIIETRNLDQIDALFNDFKVKFNSVPDAHFLYQVPIPLLQRFVSKFVFIKGILEKCLRHGAMLRRVLSLRFITQYIKLKTKKVVLRISSGCLECCAYCTIFRAVGRLKSKKINECVREYSLLLKQGYRNFELNADNLGAYGLDFGSTFPELLKSLSEVDKGLSVSWALYGLDPKWAIKYNDFLSEYIVKGKIAYIICPIQSGSNRILELMNRHYKIEEITEILIKFKKLQPKLRLDTQLIVGFPSETEKDFQETLDAVETIDFDAALFFAYYEGHDSFSSGMSNKIPGEMILTRIRQALDLLQGKGIRCVASDY